MATYRRRFKRRPIRRKRKVFRKKKSRNIIGGYKFPNVIGMPQYQLFKFKFFTNDTFSSGGDQKSTYRGNSLYDPDYDVGGTQPQYYDQITLMYNKYQVIASKIKCVVSGSKDVTMCVYPAVYVDASNPASEAYSKTGAKVVSFQTGGNPKTITSMRTTHGMHPYVPALTPSLGAFYNANPTTEWYWNIYIENLSGATTNTYVRTEITYYAMMSFQADISDA